MMQDRPATTTEGHDVGDLIDASTRFRRPETEGTLARAAAQPQQPPARPEGQVEPYVVEGEIVPDTTETAEAGPRRWVPAVRAARAERGEDAETWAVTAGRYLLRAGWQVGRGHAVWLRRAIAALTYATYRQQIRAAQAAADVAALAEWTERYRQAKAERWERILRAPKVIAAAVLAALLAVVILAGILLVIGVVVHLWEGGWTWSEWWATVGAGLDVAAWLAQAALLAGLIAAPVGWAVAAYRAGRPDVLPSWAVSRRERVEQSTVITPEGISRALAHLGIPALNRAIKDGWTIQFATPPVRVNNRGYHCVFSLPDGVTPGDLADKREVLAHNLRRDVLDVWPAASETVPGYVDLWVADWGSTRRPAPEYPLLHDGTCDVFAGVPFGVSQRGEVIAPPLVEANLVFGGMMGQGKSNAARVMMLGAALDPLAELWVYVFAGNGDFDAYRPRLARYERGTGDDVVLAAVEALRELYDEVGRRESRLAELGAKKVTRGLALKHPDLRPVIALFSECHELFGHPEYGAEAADLAVQTIRRARKTGIILAFDTQSSRKDAIPPKIVELVKINVCFAVKSWRSNDGFLGDGSFAAGIRATELRPGKDRGTAVVTGATSERFEILRWFFVEVDDDTGYDAAAEVIERAMQQVHPAVTVGAPARTTEAEERDLLVDLHEVVTEALRHAAQDEGRPEVTAAQAASLLTTRWPRTYQGLTGQALVRHLAEQGVKVPSTGNRYPITSELIRSALAKRTEAAEAE